MSKNPNEYPFEKNQLQYKGVTKIELDVIELQKEVCLLKLICYKKEIDDDLVTVADSNGDPLFKPYENMDTYMQFHHEKTTEEVKYLRKELEKSRKIASDLESIKNEFDAYRIRMKRIYCGN